MMKYKAGDVLLDTTDGLQDKFYITSQHGGDEYEGYYVYAETGVEGSRVHLTRDFIEDPNNFSLIEPEPDGYATEQSGNKQQYDSGMQRDAQDGKPRFDLLLAKDVPFSEQYLTRLAALMARGAVYYGDRNWEKAAGEEEMERFQSSALRHLIQWMAGENNEDHAAAVTFNLLAHETTKYKREANGG